jgi:hypothetical protein
MKVIGISGRAQNGKDTVCLMIQELLPNRKVVRVSFADELKAECRLLHGWNGEKDAEGRALLQKVGVDRRNENENYWVDKAFAQMTDPEAVYVIPDVRFPNEAAAVRRVGGTMWRVNRYDERGEPFDNGLTAEARNHVSETALDGYSFDRVFVNLSFGSLKLLVKTALIGDGLLPEMTV